MKFIRSITRINPATPNGKIILYMLGHGGYTWQAKRQLNVLKQEGYRVIALDFTFTILSSNPQDLIDLMNEVDEFMQKEKLIFRNLLIIGINLGGLIGYNMLRRHKDLCRLLVITVGNIALLPSSRSLRNRWKLTREQLLEKWDNVNIFYPVGTLKDKHVIMLLPNRDKVINPNEVTSEIELHKPFNKIQLVRTKGGHFRTIITETVLRPKNILKYLHELEQS